VGRSSLFLIVLCAIACGSGGPGGSGAVAAPGGGSDGGNVPDAGSATPGPSGGGDWGQYRQSPLGRSENAGIFEAAEVANLTDLWPGSRVNLGQYVYTQAVAAGGIVVYTTAFSGKVVAFDEAKGGEPIWTRQLNARIVTDCEGSKQPGFWASAAIVNGIVYAASPDGNVYALRASDGSTIWQARVADPSAAASGEFIQSSPAVSSRLGRLYVGVASSAGKACEVAGRIVAIDLGTGAVQSQALVDPGKRGAAVWSSVTIAEDEDRIYVTTGNREGPASATPYAQAFLALDPRTLSVVDHWQNPSPVEDIDFGSSPVPFDAGGRKLVAATSKDGFLYVLRRDALGQGPVWTYRIARIDADKPRVGVDPTFGWGSVSTPAYGHGLLYAAGGQTVDGSAPGSVVAFEPTTGTVLHTHETPGFVLGPLALSGEILIVASTALDNRSSWLEVLSASDLGLLRRFDANAATYAGPSVAHGAIFWTDADGQTRNLAVPKYRR
jgi:outer membrane protein assembly factor BamB